MLEKKETIKKPITKDNIFKVMLSATFGVAGVFFRSEEHTSELQSQR